MQSISILLWRLEVRRATQLIQLEALQLRFKRNQNDLLYRADSTPLIEPPLYLWETQ